MKHAQFVNPESVRLLILFLKCDALREEDPKRPKIDLWIVIVTD